MNILKHTFIFFILTCLHALTNYICFGISSTLGYEGKTDLFSFKMLGIVDQILWLPLGVLQYTKFWFVGEWNYPVMLILNSFFAIGIIYLLIFLNRPLWSRIIVVVAIIFLLWFIFTILGVIFFKKN